MTDRVRPAPPERRTRRDGRLRGRSLLVVTVVCIELIAPRGALAQREDEEPPWELTPEQLEDAGWEHQPTDSQPGSVVGGILALTVGTIVHGAGHLYAGDQRTGRQLLIGEGIALGLLGAGILIDALSNNDGSLAPLYRSMNALGASLFVATWLLDVIGTFKGTGNDLPPNSGTITDIRLAASYTHLANAGIPLRNATAFNLDVDLGAFFFCPRGGVGLDHGFFRFGAKTGVRFGLGRRELSFMDLTFEFDEVVFSEDGYAYETLVASLGFSFDLGDAFAHLDGIVYTTRLGFGAQMLRFDHEDSRPLSGDSVQSMMIVETGMSANLLDSLRVEGGYVQRPDWLVGDVSRLVGAFFATLTYALTDRLDVFVDTRIGTGFQFFIGTAFHFWP